MRLLLVFVKEPIPGSVKSRLAKDLNQSEAARYSKAMVEVLLKQLQGLNNTRIRFCYAPDDASDAIRFWLLPLMNASSGKIESVFLAPASPADTTKSQQIDFFSQGEGHLRERLNRAFSSGFDDGFNEIAAISSSCLDCGARWINTAFARLASQQRDAVLGPSHDGGIYLLALKSHTPELFTNEAWPPSQSFTTLQSTASQHGMRMETLPPLPKIQHLQDWQNLMQGPLAASIKKALGEELTSNNS